MCAIIGSYDIDKLRELAKKNAYRGSFSHSLMIINAQNTVISLTKGFGELDLSNVHLYKGAYYLAHIQAPTGGMVKDINRIHPSEDEYGNMLYHNGILKSSYLKSNDYDGWDTKLLHNKIIDTEDYSVLDEVDGSFSCIDIIEGVGITMFRNSASPMFVDSELNISSTKFDNSISTKYNTIYQIDLLNHEYNKIGIFDNKNTPYYLG